MTATILPFPVRLSEMDILSETQLVRDALQKQSPRLTWGEPVADEETQYVDGYAPGATEPSVTIAHERGRGREPWVAFGPLLTASTAVDSNQLAEVLSFRRDTR